MIPILEENILMAQSILEKDQNKEGLKRLLKPE